MDYAQAQRMFSKARSKDNGRPIANNTRLVQRGEAFAVKLHATDIVTFYPDGRVQLNTGGWRTVTTKERINRFAPCRVWSEKGTWYVSGNGAGHVFADGVTWRDGEVTGAGDDAEPKKERALRRRIAKYAKGFTDALFAGEVPAPSVGDCWFCCLRETKTDKPLGECTQDASHIESHITEGYYVPSLLVNALETFGASQAEKQTAGAYMHGQPQHAFGGRDSFVAEMLQKKIRRYVGRQLGLAV